MILCHKCSGMLSFDRDSEVVTGLAGCRCISGWVRGFEPDLTRSEAVAAQIKRQQSDIDLYRSQRKSYVTRAIDARKAGDDREFDWSTQMAKSIDRKIKAAEEAKERLSKLA